MLTNSNLLTNSYLYIKIQLQKFLLIFNLHLIFYFPAF